MQRNFWWRWVYTWCQSHLTFSGRSANPWSEMGQDGKTSWLRPWAILWYSHSVPLCNPTTVLTFIKCHNLMGIVLKVVVLGTQNKHKQTPVCCLDVKTSNTLRSLGLSSAFTAEPETSALLAQLQEHLQEPGTFYRVCVVSLFQVWMANCPPADFFPQKKKTQKTETVWKPFDAMMSHDTCETGLEKLTLR